jgi:hypothetical protein
MNVSRDTTAGCTYNDLRNKAKREKRFTLDYFTTYAIEGLLERVFTSPYANSFVLKGGVLLAVFETRRLTRDIDLHAHDLPNRPHELAAIIREISIVAIDDGLVFDTDSIRALTIRDDVRYSGARLRIDCSLATAVIALSVDINFGDPISPPPIEFELPRLLGGSIKIHGYPLEMMLAEKIVTALERGLANTRWRDFGDVYLLIQRHRVYGQKLRGSISAVIEYRAATSAQLSTVLDGFSTIAQAAWATWRHRAKLEDVLPEDFLIVLCAINEFVDPVLLGIVDDKTWEPLNQRWI